MLREAFDRHQGYEVDCEGDAFFMAFVSASGAVAAASEAQEALASHTWPEGFEFRVRMGIHTGEPLLAPPKYVGLDVHKAARIMAAGHGGQVLVSQSTRELLDERFELRDLGEHRLKDLSGPQRLFQLGDAVFLALKTLYRTNLPVPATAFLGRERELAEVNAMLDGDTVGLVTLTGSGGTGKTRLALQVAAELSDGFQDGVWWVPLAAVRDPALIMPAIAAVLDVREQPGVELADSLVAKLAGKRTLILLDNVEHLLPDAASLISGLRSAGGPLLLSTSRERLQVVGEQVYPVPSLAEADAQALFLERALALDPSFRSTAAIPELCARLDNLPLALELAAARTVLFSPEQLLQRLGQRLDLLTGSRDADPRQKTLRATIEWSYQLLHREEQRVFRALSAFAGGCTYDAAEQVGGADPDTLQSILDKSLLRRRTDPSREPRYWMLETIREYAFERLGKEGEVDEIHDRFVAAYAALAEAVRPGWHNGDERAAFRWFEDELPNVRVALDEALKTDPNAALAIASYLGWCWQAAGLLPEARTWIARIYARGPEDAFDRRCWVYSQLELAVAANETGEGESIPLIKACIPLLAEAGFEHEQALMLTYLAHILAASDPDEAEALAMRAEREAQDIGNAVVHGEALAIRAELAAARGDTHTAEGIYARLVAAAPSATYDRLYALWAYADYLVGQDEVAKAQEAMREAREIAVELSYPRELLAIDVFLALVALLDGRADDAAEVIASARPLAEKAGTRPLLATLKLAEAGVHALKHERTNATALWQSAIDEAAATGAVWGSCERAVEDRLLRPLAEPA